ncbi:hypothetical protein CSKR_107115 [Clonorchis sinensis]|uniref:Uncharacterized protein n=2 Tax=Clonorchis sinensis TaxID=79923 RepID=A0A8T1MU78_CLOSI|nr:hypothetical protein CSKR_107115 [Clonorchis sinensis]GAA55532.1 hypothetical protein CLF_108240 [Clonorchis sinensis]
MIWQSLLCLILYLSQCSVRCFPPNSPLRSSVIPARQTLWNGLHSFDLLKRSGYNLDGMDPDEFYEKILPKNEFIG